MDGRNGMVNTLEKDGRGGGHAKKFGWYPSLVALFGAVKPDEPVND